MADIEAIAETILKECQEDYVGLWSIVRTVRANLVEEASVPEVTLSVVQKLLDAGQIVAGEFRGTDFMTWEIPTSAVLSRVQQECNKLGRDPDIGEVAWFTARV
jgi:hypothetical protein